MRKNESIAFFGRTNFRTDRRVFGIKQADRRAHMYTIGKTGTGKSTLLETLIQQDIQAGRGVALLDPHGDLAEKVQAAIPEERRKDLIDFYVPDMVRPLGFNPLANVPSEKRPLVAAGLLEVFRKIWADSWGPRLEHILRNCLLTLLDQPEASLADILRLLDNPTFRSYALGRVRNGQVRDFWLREYANYPSRFQMEAIAPIQNKVGAFITDPRLQKILTQPRSSFDLRRVMDDGKILIVNLSKGLVGEDASTLLGALLVAMIGFAGQSRAELPLEDRRDFHVYLDEFHTFTTEGLAGMLAELRKYRVNLILAHQYLTQLDLSVRDAILGNVGTIITFRLGLPDAEILAKEFAPEFSEHDLMTLPNHHMYLKLMIDGVVSKPFSATTLRAFELPA
ncbi:MAG: type IV secretory system conjugative DNA transfer family protein [Vicinamibacteria bacterium]